MIALINDVTPTSQVPSATFTTASSTPFVSVEYEKNLGSRSAAHPCELKRLVMKTPVLVVRAGPVMQLAA
jgi:hypothetical protein